MFFFLGYVVLSEVKRREHVVFFGVFCLISGDFFSFRWILGVVEMEVT